MSTPADILTAHGLKNASALVAAAAQTGVALHIAAAFVEQESGGANVYGHDRGGLFPGQTVTQDNFAEFEGKVAAGYTSNGVGPLQITYPGYFPQARQQGLALWAPLDNITFGLRIVKGNLSRTGGQLNPAAQLYNSGRTDGAPSYGASVVQRAEAWKQRLAASPSVPSSPKPRWAELKVDGVWGSATTKALQAYLSTNPRYRTLVDGQFGTGTIKQMQRWLHVYVDGKFGPATKKRLQRVIGTTQDGNFGPVSVKALQRFLNARN